MDAMKAMEVPVSRFLGRVAVLVGLVLLAPLPSIAADDPTTILLVRHAEKLLTGGDVDLSVAGHARAGELVGVVRSAGVDLAVASKYKRTQQTIAPSVSDLGIATLEATEPKDVAEEILTSHRGKTVLVAGHSNTVPQIIEALGAPSLCPPFEIDEKYGCMIPDPEYDHLFVVTVPAEGPATVVRALYGSASP